MKPSVNSCHKVTIEKSFPLVSSKFSLWPMLCSRLCPLGIEGKPFLLFYWYLLWGKLKASYSTSIITKQDFPGGSVVKNLPANAEMSETWILSQYDPLEEERATHSGSFAWEIPRTEETVGLQFIVLQWVGRDWAHMPDSITKHHGLLHSEERQQTQYLH